MNRWIHTISSFGLLLLLTSSTFAQTDFAAGQLPREQLPKSRALNYEFDQVRISTILAWLKRVSVQPPVPLSGTVSGWLWAQAPSSGWWKIGDYRVEGEITSPLLGVDRFSIRQARVRFGYQKSLWTIGTAEGQIETLADNQVPRELGAARLSASLSTASEQAAHIEGQLRQVQLANLLAALGVTVQDLKGQALGDFRIDTSLANLSSPLSWIANGHIKVTPLEFGQTKNLAAETDWTLGDAVLKLKDTRLNLFGPDPQSLLLSGQLNLRDSLAWQVQLPAQPIRLSSQLYSQFLPAAVDAINLPTGAMQLAASSNGTLTPWAAQYGLQINSGQFVWLGNALSNFNAQLSLGANGLAVDSLGFQVADGSIVSAARFTSQLDEPLNVSLNYQEIDLSEIEGPSSGDRGYDLPDMSGRVSGQLQLSIDKRRMLDLAGIEAKLKGTGRAMRVADWGLGNIEYAVDKPREKTSLAVSIQDAGQSRRWLADVELGQQADQSWQYKVDARANALDLSIAQLIRLIGTDAQLPVPLETLLVTGNLVLHGDTLGAVKTIDFNFSNITTLERDRRVWSQGSMVGRTTRDYVEIDRSQWKVADSNISAAMKVHYLVPANGPRPEQVAGTQDFIDVRIDALKLTSLAAWRVINLPNSKDGRATLDGLINGKVDLKRSAPAVSWLTDWQGAVDAELSDLVLQGSPAGRIAVNGTLTPTQLNGQVTGNLLKAPVEGDVKLTLEQKPAFNVTQATGHLNWVGAQVTQLMGLWQDRQQAANWRGVSNLRTQFDWSASGQQSGSAELEVEQLVYRQRVIVRGLHADLALDNDRVRLVRLDGGLGGGRIDVSGGLNLKTQELDDVVVQLQRVSLEEASQLIDPDMQQEVKGRADVRARVRIHNGFDVHGDIGLNDVIWTGLPINELHSGFEMTSASDWSVVRVRSSNARGRVMGGRASADLQARLGSRNSLELRLRIDRGEVEQLSQWTRTASVVGKGKFDALVNVSSSNLRSLRDLRGVLDLSFEDTDARTLPVADQLARFVPLVGLPSTEFESGKLSATISQGDLRMRSLALWGRQLSVLGSGNVGISTGRLDMQLVVRTGGGLSQQVASNYLAQLAATSVPPVELVLQINRLVANRAIFLRIAGTASKPVIQPQAARMIEQTLLRALLEQVVVVGPAASAVGSATVNP